MTTGRFTYSEDILFLDRDPEQRREFLRLRTASGPTLTVTPSHLLMVESNTSDTYGLHAIFPDRVRTGHRIVINNRLEPEVDTVVSTEAILKLGVYTPLRETGPLLWTTLSRRAMPWCIASGSRTGPTRPSDCMRVL
jgi:hedgehog protein